MSKSEQDFKLTSGVGKAVYGISVLVAFCGGLFVLFIYLSFLAWAASGVLYLVELTLCVFSTLGLLCGLILFWSSKPLISRMTMISAGTLAVLGLLILLGTLNRDQGRTNVPQVSLGLVLPIVLTSIGAVSSYFKLEQLTVSEVTQWLQ